MFSLFISIRRGGVTTFGVTTFGAVVTALVISTLLPLFMVSWYDMSTAQARRMI